MVILMFYYFGQIHPVFQALLAGFFTLSITMLGAAIVFFFQKIHKTIMDSMLAISAGIMLSASFFSLLSPAIEISDRLHLTTWLIVLVGFCCGGGLLFLGNCLLDFFSQSFHRAQKSSFRRCLMLFISITLHNIPEGLVLGVAYASIP